MAQSAQRSQLSHEGPIGLDMVDQLPQRGADPTRHLLPLEVPDIVRGISGEGVDQLERFVRVEVEHEESQRRTQVPVGGLLVVFGVAEREGQHDLRLGGS